MKLLELIESFREKCMDNDEIATKLLLTYKDSFEETKYLISLLLGKEDKLKKELQNVTFERDKYSGQLKSQIFKKRKLHVLHNELHKEHKLVKESADKLLERKDAVIRYISGFEKISLQLRNINLLLHYGKLPAVATENAQEGSKRNR